MTEMNRAMRILVVDDDADFRENLLDILEAHGYDAVAAVDGFAALDRIKRSEHFDVVLMDIKMPVMDGVETFRQIKAIDPDSVVIMVTAYSRDELVKDALREGAYAIFYKPVEIEKLLGVVEEASEEGMLIMVVDDDPLFAINLKEILTKHGYRVLIAASGEEALEVARGNNIDLYLIDMKMPVMNGLETYLKLKEIRPGAVAVMITAFREEMKDLVDQAITFSAYTCLFKPVDMTQLLELLSVMGGEKKLPGDT